jgi:hypothetical protein
MGLVVAGRVFVQTGVNLQKVCSEATALLLMQQFHGPGLACRLPEQLRRHCHHLKAGRGAGSRWDQRELEGRAAAPCGGLHGGGQGWGGAWALSSIRRHIVAAQHASSEGRQRGRGCQRERG